MDLETLDKNFSSAVKVDRSDFHVFDIKQPPFRVYGLHEPYSDGEYRRMPDAIADSINDGVSYFHKDTAGGRVRFSTDSRYIALFVKMPYLNMAHMPLSGSAGFDVFVDTDKGSVFYKAFIPSVGFNGGYEGVVSFPDTKLRNITIYFPLYSHVESLQIGVVKGAYIGEGQEYRVSKPVVFYGGSHVQGGCASRPGNSYPGFISRGLSCDYVNLGFSGSALGEEKMAQYISGLDMSAFVMDYDHNAPTPEHLEKTHYKFYKIIRQANKTLPIILISKHDFYACSYYVKTQQENVDRRNIIINTYKKALSEGDVNVSFVDGKTIFGTRERTACTVDGTHPNDLGFYRIAQRLSLALKKYLC